MEEFRASRLRVQIPCAGSGSIMDAGAPDGGCGDSPKSAFCPTPPKPPPKPPPCGIPSAFLGNARRDLLDPLINPHERFVLDAEHLPLLRRELELRLKIIDATEHATETARQQIEAHLADVSRVEDQLSQHTGEEPGGG